jgi:hypothetical protein
MSKLTFLPWLRRGLVQHVTSPLDSAKPPAEATLRPYLVLNGGAIDKTVRLRGPGAVVGLSSAAFLREYPRAGTPDAEPNYFASLDLVAPDLPWIFTPSAPAAEKLRPWLVLVVVEERDGVSLSERPGAPLPVLRIALPARPSLELPSLNESWAWAHAQSSMGTKDLEQTIARDPLAVVSRLLCPRRLDSGKSWIACVVPAFDAGREVGLGREFDGATLAPAWDLATVDQLDLELPVYHSWRFSTGPEGDFKSLALRLFPRNEPPGLGVHDLDVSKPGGLIRDWRGPASIGFEGALKDPDLEGGPWTPLAHRVAFQEDLGAWLAQANGRLVLDSLPDADPVLAPPMYGSFQSGETALPKPPGAWMRTVNLGVAHRATAGLGAKVVRKNQEALMAAAWDQVGEVRAAQAELNQARLQVEVGRSWSRRVAELADGDLVQVTRALHRFVEATADGARLSSQLASSAVPAGLLSHAFLRRVRPGTAAAKAWTRRDGGRAAMTRQATNAFLSATRSVAGARARVALSPGAVPAPTSVDWSPWVGGTFQVGTTAPPPLPVSGHVLEFAQLPIPANTFLASSAGSAPVKSGLDVSAAAANVRESFDPVGNARVAMVAKVPAFATLLPAEGLPSSLYIGSQVDEPVGPVFTNALFWELLKIDPQAILPGVSDVPDDTVRLLSVNDAFVAAFLVGANHEMSRELAFREYPADLSATFFHRFWESLDGENDIESIHKWPSTTPLRDAVLNARGSSTSVLLKGALVRRYPNLVVYLARATNDAGGKTGYDLTNATPPSFFGKLGRDVVFFGFERPVEEVRGDRAHGGDPGYWVVLEEPAVEPRFGVEATVTSAPAPTVSSAHMAEATWRAPFRVLRHADTLL